MESFKDIFNSIKERFTNPLIFSFIISWLIYNWKITICLIYFNPEEFIKINNTDSLNFIASELNRKGSTLWPIIFAFVYTASVPLLKNLVRAFYSWCYMWGEKWNLSIIDGGMISVKKYIQFKNDYDQRTKTLVSILEDENQLRVNFETQKTESLKLQKDLNEERSRTQNFDEYFRQLRNFGILEGRWRNNYKKQLGKPGTEVVQILGNQYIIEGEFGRSEYKFDIKNFYYDARNGDVFFVKEASPEFKSKIPEEEHLNINVLKLDPDGRRMFGTENNNTQIEYIKLQ